jgi:hypothetical protein
MSEITGSPASSHNSESESDCEFESTNTIRDEDCSVFSGRTRSSNKRVTFLEAEPFHGEEAPQVNATTENPETHRAALNEATSEIVNADSGPIGESATSPKAIEFEKIHWNKLSKWFPRKEANRYYKRLNTRFRFHDSSQVFLSGPCMLRDSSTGEFFFECVDVLAPDETCGRLKVPAEDMFSTKVKVIRQ